MEDTKEELRKKLESILAKANLLQKKKEISLLEKQTYDASFWQDTKKAAQIMKKINNLKKEVEEN